MELGCLNHSLSSVLLRNEQGVWIVVCTYFAQLSLLIHIRFDQSFSDRPWNIDAVDDCHKRSSVSLLFNEARENLLVRYQGFYEVSATA
jgi:hypothetical protein